MAIGPDPKQIVPIEKLLMSHVFQQEALTKEEFWEMMKVVDREMKGNQMELDRMGVEDG